MTTDGAVKQQLESSSENTELRVLMEAIFEKYGVDFRDYAYSSLKRRVMHRLREEKVDSITALQKVVLENPEQMHRLLTALTIHTTAMFRDAGFYLMFREKVVPVLRTYPFLRFWIAGWTTGEEVITLAILLHEVGLYSRCRIYATDINSQVLDKAKSGIFPLSMMQDYTRNYQKSGGQSAFAEFFTADNSHVIFRPYLLDNVVFGVHNLAGDRSFNEFHGIFCRNVMIYFNRALQNRVHKLLHESLVNFGYLGLGHSETIHFCSYENCYEEVSTKERLYRKIK